ncbi:MAG: hypothetical protein U0930_25985 [Pirellulales bacterium]
MASCLCGFDPTAPSLHCGSLLPLMMRRFQRAGHRPIAAGRRCYWDDWRSRR